MNRKEADAAIAHFHDDWLEIRGRDTWDEPIETVLRLARLGARIAAPTEEEIEKVAKAIYAHWLFGAGYVQGDKVKPQWVPSGNSDKQDEARRFARAALTSIGEG